MKISLNEFEQQIDETILKRGLKYFNNGNVTFVEEIGNGEYEASVEGSETYTVNLTINHDILTEYDCDCPYDMGPVCKHIAAVLFHLQQDTLLSAPPLKKTKTKNSQPRKKSVSEEIDTILKALPQNELLNFIRDTCKKDRGFRLLFLSRYAYLTTPCSKELYTKQIQGLINAYAGRHGFIEYANVRPFINAISEILNEAHVSFERREYSTAMHIAFAVIEELTGTLDMLDDSSGYLGDTIYFALGIINSLTNVQPDESFRKELFDNLLDLYKSNKLKGWDWHSSMIEIAIDLIKTNQETEQIRNLLDSIKPSENEWDWNYKTAQELTSKLIQKTGSNKEVKDYMLKNISNPTFREKLIQDAIKEKDYGTAMKFAEEGIEKDVKKSPGMINKWQKYLLNVYQQTGDTENIIRLTRHFLLDFSHRNDELKIYYNTLKAIIPDNSWNEYLKDIITDILKGKPWGNYHKISTLYIWEKDWDKLLKLLQQNPNLSQIEDAEKYLAKLYPDELIALYRNSILSFLEQNVGRSHYKETCRYIRRMKKLGGKTTTEELVQNLRVLYRNRKALLEELDKI